MRRAAAWTETVNDGHALERVRETTGLSDGGAEVEARDRVRWATGSWVGERGGCTLGGWRPLRVGIWYVGSGIGGPGNSKVVLGGAGAGGLVGGGGATLGDQLGGTLGGGEGVGGCGGGSCGFVVHVQFWNKSRSWRMASSWASISAEGGFLQGAGEEVEGVYEPIGVSGGRLR